MAKRSEEKFIITVGARVTRADAEKLAELARLTARDQAGVIRLLIRNATVAAPDIHSGLAAVGAGAGEPDAA
jgi:hypothetical protein